MKKVMIAIGLVAILVSRLGAEEPNEELRLLRAEVKMLKAKIESQQKEIELLKAELASAKAGATSQPAATSQSVKPAEDAAKKTSATNDYMPVGKVGEMVMKSCPEELFPLKGKMWSDDTRSAASQWLTRQWSKSIKVKGVFYQYGGYHIYFRPELFTVNGREYEIRISGAMTDAWKAHFLGLTQEQFEKTDEAILELRLKRRLVPQMPIVMSGKIYDITMETLPSPKENTQCQSIHICITVDEWPAEKQK